MVKGSEKARRARMRKAAGLKRFSELFAERQQRDQDREPQRLRRSAFLVSYACFTCRKSFKKPFVPDRRYKCPQCAQDMAHLGRSFKAPRKTEKQQWEKVRRLWSAGYRFHTNTRRQAVQLSLNNFAMLTSGSNKTPNTHFGCANSGRKTNAR